jgi:hypothetical protein
LPEGLVNFAEIAFTLASKQITISGYYNRNLNANELASLYDITTRESIHRTKGAADMLWRPLTHEDIYAEAKKRTEERYNKSGKNSCGCGT